MINLAEYLNCRVAIYRNTKEKNDLNQTKFVETFDKEAWANIKVKATKQLDLASDITLAKTEVIFTFRKKSINDISRDMFFIYQNEKYEIEYFLPHFKYNDRIEVYCYHSVN